jgi:hypothetical protein
VVIKSLSGSCNLKIKNKASHIIILSIDEGSYRFFADLHGISCEFTGEGNSVNHSDKIPEEIRPRNQNFDKIAEKIIDINSDNFNKSKFGQFQMQNNYTIIIIMSVTITILIIICYCYCNRTKVLIATASGFSK